MRIRAIALMLALHLASAGAGAQPADAGPFAGKLPLRRDAASVAEPGSWASPALLLGLTGAAGAWAWWRHSTRRRTASARDGDKIAVTRLSSQALTPQASVHAVRWNGEEFLLGCTAQQVTLLSRRPAPPPQEQTP